MGEIFRARGLVMLLAVFFLMNLGLILFSGFIDWKALLTGHPPPAWMFIARPRRG